MFYNIQIRTESEEIYTTEILYTSTNIEEIKKEFESILNNKKFSLGEKKPENFINYKEILEIEKIFDNGEFSVLKKEPLYFQGFIDKNNYKGEVDLYYFKIVLGDVFICDKGKKEGFKALEVDLIDWFN